MKMIISCPENNHKQGQSMKARGLQTLIAWVVARAWIACCKWPTNGATYYYSGLPVGMQSPTDNGANAWTNVLSSSWTWTRQVGSGNLVAWGTIDGAGGLAATTTTVAINGKISSMTLVYDQAENWYTGTGTPGSNQVDTTSIATHELGHALGLLHTQSQYCHGNNLDPTMCAAYFLGTTWFRTLENDDIRGVVALYP